MKAIAVIPARGGSKRIPRKNVRPFAGRPVIALTIEAALDSGLFHRTIVSTDDEEIARIAVRYGAEVPFLRERALADDVTPVSLATLDTLNRLDPDGARYEWVAQLMANCPLRTAEDVRDSFRQFAGTAARSQISVTRFGWLNPWWAVTCDTGLALRPVFADRVQQRSQDLPELYCPTGAIWWARCEVLRAEGTFHTADRAGWILPWQRAVDIDTDEDWQFAEALYGFQRAPSKISG